jgi:hypothetical protein
MSANFKFGDITLLLFQIYALPLWTPLAGPGMCLTCSISLVDVEREIQHIPLETAEEVQEEASYILRCAESQKQNTSKAEQDALRTLWSNESVMILLPIKAT